MTWASRYKPASGSGARSARAWCTLGLGIYSESRRDSRENSVGAKEDQVHTLPAMGDMAAGDDSRRYLIRYDESAYQITPLRPSPSPSSSRPVHSPSRIQLTLSPNAHARRAGVLLRYKATTD